MLNMLHPSSQLMIGVFDHDSGFTEGGHDFIGRVVVNLSNLRPNVLYTTKYDLHRSPRHSRTPHGSVTLRLRLEFPNGPRNALLAGTAPVFSFDISVAERPNFKVARHTITHGVCLQR